MIATTSSIDDLIKSQNPFAGHLVVRPQQIWGKSFPDVPSINAHASNAVFEAVDKIRQGKRETVGITITAYKGLGKSHIISRIRHALQADNDSIFIYMSKYDNLNKIKHEFLQNVASNVSRAFVGRQVMQWTEIASALLNEGMKWKYTPEQYLSNVFPTLLSKYSNKVVDQLTIRVQQMKPNISNPYIIQAILWTLSIDHAVYANRWLSGLEITQEQAEFMGLLNTTKEDRENEALSNARQIIDIISDYKIPVICFDELDIADIADNGFTAAQIIANLVKDLYNNLKRGVLLLAMYPGTWNEQIRALPEATAVIDRLVSEQADKRPIELKHLSSDDIIALVKVWLQEFYQENKQTPPHPLYPFDENKLRELAKVRPTVRSVLKWCAENFIPTIPPIDPVKPCYQSELANVEASIDSLMEDNTIISNTLKLAFNRLIGQTVEGIKIEAIEEVKASPADSGYLNFKIIGNNRKVKIGVAVIQQAGGKFVGAALGRLIDYNKLDLTRGCLVRSKQINPAAALAREKLRILLKEKGGEWVGLQSQDIKPLLAILYVYANRESYKLKEEQIFEFIEQKKLAINNPLIREILSDPSGQEPTKLTYDGLPINIPQSVVTNNYV